MRIVEHVQLQCAAQDRICLTERGQAAYAGAAKLDERDSLSFELAAVSSPGGRVVRYGRCTRRGLEAFGSVDRGDLTAARPAASGGSR
jgi:hypothetical protein